MSESSTREQPSGLAAVEVKNLRCRRGERELFHIHHWALPASGHGLLQGPSGCGKTTLLHLIAGLDVSAEGQLTVLGEGLLTKGSRQRDRFRARRIGLVFQDFHLLEGLTVEDNLRLAGWLGTRGDRRRPALELLDRLGLSGLARAWPHTLSQGEKQRVAIARALINHPDLILADEPTSALDDDNAEAVIRLLMEEADHHGASLLVSTHDARIADHFPHQLRLGGDR
ncbi:ATP-binding cassette domain-containing protein [Natronospira bacteriovora]|uniref:ATP-binding cassette domain-containing protein n=1 Tax=Natronospira bacteriovora TaxID=3069753 RepID=A0ABU0WAH2_9GAMM|nr:ATP-binding cassette domain-containing protein [Natronospira sp. AB-CW4]MDQ2070465.1 ATP-binding cassette domain-containing protein [Natronospira sp. AB-CW4]